MDALRIRMGCRYDEDLQSIFRAEADGIFSLDQPQARQVLQDSIPGDKGTGGQSRIVPSISREGTSWRWEEA
ncbi:hypothetical protein BB560_002495, partial [Smittium megazygosporum]